MQTETLDTLMCDLTDEIRRLGGNNLVITKEILARTISNILRLGFYNPHDENKRCPVVSEVRNIVERLFNDKNNNVDELLESNADFAQMGK